MSFRPNWGQGIAMSNFGDDAQYKTSEKLFARADMFKRFGRGGGGWHTWAFDRLLEAGLPVEAQIVDVGGGPGWFWQHNQARIPTGWRVMHTDLSPGMVAEARANIARPGSSFKVVDAEQLPFPDAGLDALIANHMLYHVRDRARALRDSFVCSSREDAFLPRPIVTAIWPKSAP